MNTLNNPKSSVALAATFAALALGGCKGSNDTSIQNVDSPASSSVKNSQNEAPAPSSSMPRYSETASVPAPITIVNDIEASKKIAAMTARQICTEILKPEKAANKKPAKTHSCGERDCNETEADYRARKASEEEVVKKTVTIPSKEQLTEYAEENGIDCGKMRNEIDIAARVRACMDKCNPKPKSGPRHNSRTCERSCGVTHSGSGPFVEL